MWAILYNWKANDRLEKGLSLNNRPKQAMNTPGCHHALLYHYFPDIQLYLKIFH